MKVLLKLRTASVLLCALALALSSLSAISSPLSGLAGALKTPTAQITPSGQFIYQYNSLLETRFESGHSEGRNHTFSLGFYNRIELGGRLTDFTPLGERYDELGRKQGTRDLSGNIKIQPFKLHKNVQFAFGAYDFAGEAQKFSSKFAVTSLDLLGGRFSIGYASAEVVGGTGAFASVVYPFYDYFQLMLEYDTENQFNAGLQIEAPINGQHALQLTLASLDGEFTGGIGLKIPLGGNSPKTTDTQSFKKVIETSDKSVAAFQARLLADNFETVRVGTKADSVVVVLEDRVRRRSSLDSIAGVMAAAVQHLPEDGTLEIQLNDRRVPVFSLVIDLLALRQYLLDHSVISRDNLLDSLQTASAAISFENVEWLPSDSKKNKTWAELGVGAAVRSAVGTEYGVVDLSLAAELETQIPLWQGATAVASFIVPVATTDNFADGGSFEQSAHETKVEHLALRQRLAPKYGIHTMFEVGQTHVLGNSYSMLTGNAAWLAQNSGWGALAEAGYYEFQDGDVSRQQLSATVRYSFDQQDVVIDASFGEYFFGDTGAKLSLTRRFQDTFVQLFVNVIDSDDLSGGVRVSLPLAPAKGYKRNGVAVNGSRRWSHSLTTTIKDPVVVGSNRLRPGFLLDPVVNEPLFADVLDSGRLTRSYLATHMGLLRQKIQTTLR